MRKGFFSGIAIALSVSSIAQVNNRQQIDKLCGCFEVDFKYAETFSPDPNYKFHDREEIGATAELALPLEVSDKKVVIQHLLVVSPTAIVKHWREEWVYEASEIWKYIGDRTWVKEPIPAEEVKGKWVQTVWEVADEPRYQGFSSFAEFNGQISWQNTTDAPLPRREYSVRSDYNILRRTNRITFTDTGYLHEQDNRKIIRKDGKDLLLAEEKGWNTYKKIEEKECQAAKDYWEKNKAYWSVVRTVWSEILKDRNKVSLREKVEGKMLHEYLIALGKDSIENGYKPEEVKGKIVKKIGDFLL